jgi:hypothetical protein
MVLGLVDHALDAFMREQDSRAEARRRPGRVAVVLDLMHPAGAVRHLVRAGRYAGRDVAVGTRRHGYQRGRWLRAGKYRLQATGVTKLMSMLHIFWHNSQKAIPTVTAG